MKRSFTQKVYQIVKQIPRGKVLTYQQVAQNAGNSKAYRAVGNILSHNTNKSIPCHRVIRSDGKLGGYNGLQGHKAQLIQAESIH